MSCNVYAVVTTTCRKVGAGLYTVNEIVICVASVQSGTLLQSRAESYRLHFSTVSAKHVTYTY